MFLPLLRLTRNQPPGGGLARFREALQRVPEGGEAQVWVRMPLKLGDLVMTLPVLYTLREAWDKLARARDVRLKFVLTGRGVITLLRGEASGLFAECHVDGEPGPGSDPFHIVRYWGGNKPLAAITFSKSDRLKLAAWLGGVPVRAGIADGGNNWSLHFSHRYETYNIGHRVFRHMPLLRWLAGPDVVLRQPLLAPGRVHAEAVAALLAGLGWKGGPYVVFGAFPNAGNPERGWFPADEPWLKLAALARRDGVTPVLAGSGEHREGMERIAAATGSLCLAGRTDLPQLLALVAGAMGTVSVDTGIAHLAAATGKPTVVVFGAGLEYWDMPCGPRVVALRGDPVGEPVYPTPPADPFAYGWPGATRSIPAERAWSILNGLAAEAPGP